MAEKTANLKLKIKRNKQPKDVGSSVISFLNRYVGKKCIINWVSGRPPIIGYIKELNAYEILIDEVIQGNARQERVIFKHAIASVSEKVQ